MVRQVTSTRAPPSGTKRSFLMPYKNGKSADFFKTPARLEFQRGVRPISAVLEARRGWVRRNSGSESAPPPAAGGESSANPQAPLPALNPADQPWLRILLEEGLAFQAFALRIRLGRKEEP